MHPPALIDTCMSFRIDQLQEVRTAPAAHGGRPWPEGPMAPSSRRSWLAKQALVGGGRSLGAEGPSAATVARPNGYGLETGDAACDGLGNGRRWHRGTALPLLGSMRGYRLKMRKGMPGGRSREGREGRGGRPEAGPSRPHWTPPYCTGKARAPLSLRRGHAHRQQPATQRCLRSPALATSGDACLHVRFVELRSSWSDAPRNGTLGRQQKFGPEYAHTRTGRICKCTTANLVRLSIICTRPRSDRSCGSRRSIAWRAPRTR